MIAHRHTPLRHALKSERGAAMVEFALVLPLLVVLLFGVLDVSRGYNYWVDETHLANEAVRYAVVNANVNGDLADYIRDQADSAELRSGLSVCIAPAPGASSPPQVGDPIVATATYTYTFLPLIGDIVGATKQIRASAVMRLETPITTGVLTGGSCS